ncbi:MFS transporter [Nocardia iowensis]|uniref:MFS transporter n=1 Tax=Nocardia iowensis TaxID=204891 RepID=A0ABX8S1W0_NOCIO|nr:MFS transporter [Nocardia iowensis]QXN94610.1 MFS transporter [Nocardia iowensis]
MQSQSSAIQVGFVSAGLSMPVVVFSLWAGLAARKMSRAVLLVCNLVRAGSLGLLSILYALSRIEFSPVLLIALLIGSATTFSDVAYQMMISGFIPRSDLTRGIGLLQAIVSVVTFDRTGHRRLAHPTDRSHPHIALSDGRFRGKLMRGASLRPRELWLWTPDQQRCNALGEVLSFMSRRSTRYFGEQAERHQPL